MDSMTTENKAALMAPEAHNGRGADALLMLDAPRLQALGLARELRPGDQLEVRGRGRVLDAGAEPGITVELQLTGLALCAAPGGKPMAKDGPDSASQEAFFRALFGGEG